jgi:hypothetical protein
MADRKRWKTLASETLASHHTTDLRGLVGFRGLLSCLDKVTQDLIPCRDREFRALAVSGVSLLGLRPARHGQLAPWVR